MSLKLNKLTDDVVREDIANNRGRVEKFLAADPSSPMRKDAVRFSRRLADAALELGLELYQQESDGTEIRKYLAAAGNELLAVLSVDDERAALSPLEFEKALALAVCFGAPGQYGQAGSIPIKRFYADPASLSFFALMARYLDVLRGFLTSGKLDGDALSKVEAECLKSNAPKFDAQVTLAKVRALKAVNGGDAALLNESIATLVEDHENEAKRGENQKSTRGFVCLPGLMFAHLGAARGLQCTVQSPYLPLHLPGQ
jgi:hypothetical protein